MKKICIVSDTHKNLDFVRQLIQQISGLTIDLVIHLGDNYEDADLFIKAGYDLVRVPGIWTHHYEDMDIPNRLFLTLETWRLFLSHSQNSTAYDLPSDPKPEDIISKQAIDLFLFGHTHMPEVKKEGHLIFINPGHLKSAHEIQPPTYLIAELDPAHIKLYLYDFLTQKVLHSYSFNHP